MGGVGGFGTCSPIKSSRISLCAIAQNQELANGSVAAVNQLDNLLTQLKPVFLLHD